jgi:FtsP/CotA-like multicopper oxidase with cupredoxin domain/YHS domain-containing protein
MGRFGNTFLINGETQYAAAAAVGEVVRIFLINTANTRIFNVALPGARMKLVGGDSGRFERESFVDEVLLAPSERVVIDVRFDKAGEVKLEHRTPDETFELGAFVVDGARASDSATPFDELRVDTELSTLRRSLDRDFARAPDKILAFVASMPLLYADAAPAEEYVCPMHPEVTSREAGRCPKCGMKLVPKRTTGATSASNESGHGTPRHGHGAGAHHHGGATHHHHGGGDGLEWSDEMPEINRASDSANMLWKIIDRSTGDENHAINWTFTVGDRVKMRLINEMESDHPMHHPFHVHGAGRFVILSRNGVVEPNLAWKDTVLVRAGETVDILLDVTNPGSWMAHCHIAEHIEAGMMFSFRVLPFSEEAAMQDASADQVLDPVCGMIIERKDAAATRQLDGETYYLCSTSCAEKFDADSAAYVAATRSDGYDKWYGTPPSNGGHAHGTQSDINPN